MPKSWAKNQRNCKKNYVKFFLNLAFAFHFSGRCFDSFCSIAISSGERKREPRACCSLTLRHILEAKIKRERKKESDLVIDVVAMQFAITAVDSISTYILFVCNVHAVTSIHGNVLVSFHHQNWCFISIFYCHLCRCKSYFVWHEWDIFCLIKFKLCFAQFGSVSVWLDSYRLTYTSLQLYVYDAISMLMVSFDFLFLFLLLHGSLSHSA